jgi:carotenoid cleavage dioxygenase-like enzyme
VVRQQVRSDAALRDGVRFNEPGLPPIGGNNQSNVSPVYHAGKLLTSGEIAFPYQIDPSDLSTIGVYDFDGALETSFTAHPKIDRRPATCTSSATGSSSRTSPTTSPTRAAG